MGNGHQDRDMDQGQQMAIVVISRRDTVGTACIGPFPTPEAAQEWRERHVTDYPDGSQFDILTPTRPTY